MKILITGGCGFIGSNFALKQVNETKNIILNYDKLTYAGNKDNLLSIIDSKNYTFINGDICNYDQIEKTVMNFKPEGIIHFAAESHVDRSIDNPQAFIQTNIVGTSYLLNATRKYFNTLSKNFKNQFRFIHISTDEVFGSLGSKGYFNEKTPYSPNSPYSASKASSDFLVRSWNKTYKIPTIVTNCSNNYGPFQFPEKLIPLIIANCFDEKPLPIYGKGENIRDWLYVEDHCDAIAKVLYEGVVGETYNIGGENEYSNLDLVKIICKEMDKLKPRKNLRPYADLINFVNDRPGHDFRYAIDSRKIQSQLNWRPNEDFKSGIVKTIKWYISNESWWRKIQKLTYSQERLGI